MYIEYKVDRHIDITAMYSAFEIRYEPGFQFDGEDHNFWEFVYVIDGTVGVSADKNVYELSKHQLIFHKPMEFHKLWVPEGSFSHLFIGSFRAEGEAVNRFSDGVFALKTSQQEMMEGLLDIIRQPDAENLLNPVLCLADLQPYLMQNLSNRLELLLLSLLDDNRKVRPMQEDKNAILYNKTIRTMEQYLYSQLSVPELARECGISVSALNKLFASYLGCGVHKYFIKMKIKRAIELMHQGMPIGQISEMLGFNNQNYFSMVFKRETGASPRNYLQEYK